LYQDDGGTSAEWEREFHDRRSGQGLIAYFGQARMIARKGGRHDQAYGYHLARRRRHFRTGGHHAGGSPGGRQHLDRHATPGADLRGRAGAARRPRLAPGFWRWEHERHVWAPGHWIAERPGHHWVADRWAHVEGPHGGWRHEPGHWDHG